MNQMKRNILRKARSMLENASELVIQVRDDEQDSFDNLPEGIQESERGQKMEEAIDAMDSAMDSISEAIEHLEEASQ